MSFPDEVIAENVDWDKWVVGYIREQQQFNDQCTVIHALADLCGLVTYSDTISDILLDKFLTAIEHIINKTTFEYIKDDDNHVSFITMVNLPRIYGYLEWGSSIRGAWLTVDKLSGSFYPDTLCNEVDDVVYVIKNAKELTNFWLAIIKHYRGLNNEG